MPHPAISAALDQFYEGNVAGAEAALKALGAVPTGLPPLDEAQYHELLGNLALARGDGPAADTAFRAMIALEERGGADASSRGASWSKLAGALAAADKLPEAAEALDKALALKQEAKAPPHARMNILFGFAQALFARGRYEEAAKRFAQAVEAAEAAALDAASLANLLLYNAESWKHHIGPLQKSLKMQRGAQGNSAQLDALERRLEEQFKQAVALFQRALELVEKSALGPELKFQLQRSLAETYHDAGKYVKAVMHRNKLAQMAEALKLPALELGYIFHGLGDSQLEQGNAADAAESLRKALALKEKGNADAVSRAKSWFALGQALAAQKRWEPAVEAFTKARDLEDGSEATDENHKLRRKRYWGASAACLEAAGKADAAKAAQQQADAI
ncbi:MAG: tetratricopeptide repeat protein [Planctomycetes bacterium]|nr:tetratricopeptide repeat protein [Planctomycetota bacterium]